MIGLTEFRLSVTQGNLTGWPANRLRGALGASLRHIACATKAPRCEGCPLLQTCAYAYCYETQAVLESKFHGVGQEVPRPYVVRLAPKGADTPGEVAFELVLVGRAVDLLPYFLLAVREWQADGRGPGRQTATLQEAIAIQPLSGERFEVYSADDATMRVPPWSVGPDDLDSAVQGLPTGRLEVEFLSPTRLKHRGQLLNRPEFNALVAALARRIEAMQQCHDLPAIVDDGRALVKLSEGVELVEWTGEERSRHRYSYRQRREMRLEGFIGRAVYEGDLKPFFPLLRIGELVHVGKGAVLGLGRYRVATQA